MAEDTKEMYLTVGDNLTVIDIDEEGEITLVDDDGHKYYISNI